MAKRPVQLDLDFRRHGGPRRGSGRPKTTEETVPHSRRAPLARRHPVHVTLRLVRGLPPLRRGWTFRALRRRFRDGRDRNGFRLVHFVVMSTHIHLIVEAEGRRSLSRGMQGLAVRVARCLNGLWARKGQVFFERYHEHVLRTPLEVRRALAHVLNNARKHGVRLAPLAIDRFSSGEFFEGWHAFDVARGGADPPVVGPRTWLLRIGWKRHGRIDVGQSHGSSAARTG